ncbi:WhiB family transcriptional regulator [Streptomyces sp. NPDC020298]|uniref:WhiB family transcriptional regulator n=1 Tax=unclassified Streptomyces TaxID=2593676 RepID=UPI0033C1ABD1
MNISFLPQPADQTWQKQAACRAKDVDPDVFFSENNVAGIAKARQICKGCPVAQACLIDCMTNEGGKSLGARHGIYAGMSPRQRQRLYEKLRDRAKNQTKPVDPDAAGKASKPRKPTTLQGIYDANTTRTYTGHLAWTGSAQIHFRGRVYTPRQLAFLIDRGQHPDGRVTSECGVTDCVLPQHLADATERSRCGTRPGYQKHLREKTEICAPCRQANTDADNRLRRTGTTKQLAA